MVDKKYIEYGRKLRSQGRTDEQITAALINSDGLTEEQVAEVLAQSKVDEVVSASAEPAGPETPSEQTKPRKKWWPFWK